MHRPTHSTTVMTTLAAIVSPPFAPAPEPRRLPRPGSDSGLFIVGDLVLVPAAGAARGSIALSTPGRR